MDRVVTAYVEFADARSVWAENPTEDNHKAMERKARWLVYLDFVKWEGWEAFERDSEAYYDARYAAVAE